MKYGSMYTLKSDIEPVAEKDQQYSRIYSSEVLEFEFAVPRFLKSVDVEKSTLAVTGYYERYRKLIAEAYVQRGRVWTNHGTVLDAAKGRLKEKSEIVGAERLRWKWQIEEREPEVATIVEARLMLTLPDGRQI